MTASFTLTSQTTGIVCSIVLVGVSPRIKKRGWGGGGGGGGGGEHLEAAYALAHTLLA